MIAADRWSRIPATARALALAVVLIVAFVVLLRVADESLTDEVPGGPRSSSYATADQGLAALADVLVRFGHDVDRVRGPIAAADLTDVDTVFVLDPTAIDADAVAHLLAYVSNGGRVVIGGDDPGRYLPRLRRDPPMWAPGGADRHRVGTIGVDGGRFDRITEVRTRARGQFVGLGSSTPVVLARTGSGVLVAVETVGNGVMLFVADVSPLANDTLAAGDNAALGVALAGPDGARVAFMEGVHGYGDTDGLAALPTRWQRALMLFGAATVLALWARSRRLGPPEEPRRDLPPARAEYVDALATTLRRAGRPADAGPPLVREVHRLLRARGLTSGTESPDDLRRVLVDAGLDDEQARVVTGGVRDDADLLAAGRALTHLSRWSGSVPTSEPRSEW